MGWPSQGRNSQYANHPDVEETARDEEEEEEEEDAAEGVFAGDLQYENSMIRDDELEAEEILRARAADCSSSSSSFSF